MSEGLIKDAYEKIIKEIQSILTFSYIVIIGIGMLFTYQKYSEFNINIFDYADVFEFLIAPFSDPYIVLFSSLSISFIFLLIRLDVVWRAKYPSFYIKASFGIANKPWYETYRKITFGSLIVFYLIMSSDIYGRFMKTKVQNQSYITVKFSNGTFQRGQLIGKTKEVLFLLKEQKVNIIPITSSVEEINLN